MHGDARIVGINGIASDGDFRMSDTNEPKASNDGGLRLNEGLGAIQERIANLERRLAWIEGMHNIGPMVFFLDPIGSHGTEARCSNIIVYGIPPHP